MKNPSRTRLKPRQSLIVRIVDTNPLLLTYGAAVTKEETEQHKTAAEFLKEFSSWLTTLGYQASSTSNAIDAARGGDLTKLVVEGLNFAAFHERLRNLYERLNSLKGKLADSLEAVGSNEVKQLKKEVREWNASEDQAALSYVALALVLRNEVLDSARVVSGFAADVAKLRDPLPIARVGYLPGEDQRIVVTIAASDVYKAFLDDATREERDTAVKTFTVTASPYAAAGWSLGAAVVAPLIDNPTFTAEKVGDTFVIRSKQDDSRPYQLAAMLTIEPRLWRDQVFGVGYQVGISPAKEKVALYVGPHFRIYAVSIGGGLLLQRTSQLEKGLAVGQELAAESDLRLDTRLRTGGYIQASVALFKK